MDRNQTENKNQKRIQLGAEGERRAVAYLESLGYRIIDLNWRCRTGEIDIIAEFEGCLIFAEVRSRRNTGTYGTAQESYSLRKQIKVRETAKVYLHATKQENKAIRFDAVCVSFHRDGSMDAVSHYPYAF
jgi:putative endonuclease